MSLELGSSVRVVTVKERLARTANDFFNACGEDAPQGRPSTS